MIKLAIFQDDLGYGGIQKSLVNLLKNIDYNSIDVDLYLFKNKNLWENDLPDNVNIKYLKPINSIYKFIPFKFALCLNNYNFDKNIIYDLAVDFNSYQPSCAIGAITVPAKKRAIWIHNNVDIKYHNEWKYRILFNAMKAKYWYFDTIVPCSNALQAPFVKLTGLSNKKFVVINNYIDVDAISSKIKNSNNNFCVDQSKTNFVAVGKLCHQKGYDLMLQIFKSASQFRDDLMLYIIGDGPDRKKLEKMKGDNVVFLGNIEYPYSIMNLMDAFISTSRYEGQPLNIKEAEVVGLPLFCSKNLEAYSDGLVGYDDLVNAIVKAEKSTKSPNKLTEYNQKILDSIKNLAFY